MLCPRLSRELTVDRGGESRTLWDRGGGTLFTSTVHGRYVVKVDGRCFPDAACLMITYRPCHPENNPPLASAKKGCTPAFASVLSCFLTSVCRNRATNASLKDGASDENTSCRASGQRCVRQATQCTDQSHNCCDRIG